MENYTDYRGVTAPLKYANCANCKFNFDGICASGDEDLNKYGAEIKNLKNSCEGFAFSFEAFCRDFKDA